MASIRFATFNSSLNRNSAGELIGDLSAPDDEQAQAIARIIQIVNPDVLLINEFDFDPDGIASVLFQDNYLSSAYSLPTGEETTPVEYPFVYLAPSNTGIASGFDLDNDGAIASTPGEPGYGNDAFGFGNFPGQFGMLLLSKFPIVDEEVRTFQNFLWQDMPGALLPDNPDTLAPGDWYSPEELAVFPLASKSFWDVPIDVEGEIVHVLASHPTPPVFDGPEDRNGLRNHDEIRFWADYITPGGGDYIYDDLGDLGGLAADASFVILGDQNADPNDGDSFGNAIAQLLDNPRVNTSVIPASPGGTDAADRQGGANASHGGDPAFDTADFGDENPGNLRMDYVLPADNLDIIDAGIFWPEGDDPLLPIVEVSDHRLVWVDVETAIAQSDITISDIQGSGATSSLAGEVVTDVPGIVTAVVDNGFYLQDPVSDNSDRPADGPKNRSSGIFVFTGDSPDLNVGDEVLVSGTVSEFIPGGASTNNLSTTQIGGEVTIAVLSSDNSLPEPVVIGTEGQVLPTEVIAPDGIDFWERLEGMLVTVSDAVAVSPTTRFNEIYALADNGLGATGVNSRGGITIAPDDFNPERIKIQLDRDLLPDFDIPQVNVGDRLGDITGVISYGFGNFQVLPTAEFTAEPGDLEPEVTAIAPEADKLTIASYNVLNLDPNDDEGRFEEIGLQIVDNLNGPDIIALQEVQDNDGSIDSGDVNADLTYSTLIDAIVAAGGPTYEFLDSTPVDGEDGGQPGGNIRVGYLYNPDRVNFRSEQRLEDPAFDDSRKPLVATFEFEGDEVTVINNHFSSKGGSSPLFGEIQPPINGSAEERDRQAEVVNDFVDNLLLGNPDANVVVLGDLNEFEFEETLTVLKGDNLLVNLTETLPPEERYTFIFQGNSQALDHILVSDNLVAGAEYDIVHLNAEFAGQVSDHDPIIVSLALGDEEETTVELVGFAQLPADTFADGPPAGAGIEANDRMGPFPAQPVQGFSGVQFANEELDEFWFLSDNGFGSQDNSADYLLRIYRLAPDFTTPDNGSGEVEVLDFIQLADPNNLIPFPIVNSDTAERWLTGADFDIESFTLDNEGNIWIGDEFGPFLLKFNTDGTLTEAPIPTPNIVEFDTLTDSPPLVIGHRGASGELPEHTLEAYQLAMEQGADFVEPDLVITADGVLIARHEPLLDDTTNVAEVFPERLTTKSLDGEEITGYFAEDFTLEEIKQLRAVQPRPYRDQSFNGQFEIPTFQEVIELVQEYEEETGREVGIYPETKHPTFFDDQGLSLEEPLIDTLLETGFTEPDRIFIQSFELQNLIELQDQLAAVDLEDIPLVQLFGDIEGQFVNEGGGGFSVPFDFVANFGDEFDETRAREIYGDLVDLVDFSSDPDYGDLANGEVIDYISSYAAGLGPWKNSFLLREDLEEPVDGNGDGEAEITTQLTGEVFPLIDLAHDAGLQVHPYTLRDEERFLTLNPDGTPQTPTQEFLQLTQLGADGFFTDFPSTGRMAVDMVTGEEVMSPQNPFLEGPEMANIRGSRGFEGMAISPDRSTIYPMLEGSVAGDPPNALRIYEFDPETSEYEGLLGFYRVEDPSHAIGDFTAINDSEYLVIERDGGQAETAAFKQIFKVNLEEIDAEGFVSKELVVDLLEIDDPNDLNGDGSNSFDFPFFTIEDVLVIDENTILVANDNNYPFSVGRPPEIDNNEIILLELDEPLDVDPQIFDLPGDEMPMGEFQLQILHASDQEGGLSAIADAVGFSAVLNALEDDFANTLKLSSGDIYIPGPFLNASDDVYGQAGIGDILINNALGFQAVAFGNHEFDLGPGLVNDLLRPNPEITGPGIGPEGYPGTAFPYLSTNLDFSGEPDLAELVVEPSEAPQPNSIADSVVIEVGGEPIGIVGATTPSLPSISSIGNITVTPADDTDIEALAAEIQETVDAITATGINKVILLTHMQQAAIDIELAGLLSDVDVIMAGGSNTLLANPDRPLRPGDEAIGPYPLELTSASDEPIFIINTDGNYKYVGRLVADFDENGIIVNILEESGVFATDEAGVDRVYDEDVDPAEVADPLVVEVTEAIADVVLDKDGNLFGRTSVFLNGLRENVRTEETNLGNLTGDANLFVAQQYDETVTVSIKNGGGIREAIGRAIVPPGSTTGELELLPPAENPLTDPPKREGDISQLDIENALRFNNDLSLVTVTASELKQILEHAVADTAPGNTPGRFPQIRGLAFSFDATRQAIAFTRDDAQVATGVETEGARVRSLALKDEEGNILDVVVRDGEVVGDGNREIRLVTLGFLADGGSGYPFPLFGENRVDLTDEPLPSDADNVAEFTDNGTEQDALAEYLAANFPADNDPATPMFDVEDVGPELDENIQNLAARSDTVLEETPMPMPGMGTPGNDILIGKTTSDTISGGTGDDAILGGDGDDRLSGDPGNDLLLGGPGADSLLGGMGNDTLFGIEGNDFINGGPGDDTLSGGPGQNILLGGTGSDIFVLRTGSATPDRRDADVLVEFEVGVDAIGLTGGLTFDDLVLEPLGTSTLIKIDDGSERILGFVNRVTPDELLPNSFVPVDIGQA